MVVYYFLFTRLIRNRVLKFAPKISTSQKSHGKWGDFIICIIPIMWCVNILSNSNFILRMIEWQTESSIFTVRVRGRQWYWVYKIELKELLSLNNTTKNNGHNFWKKLSNKNYENDIQTLNLMQIRQHNEEYLKKVKINIKEIRNMKYSKNSSLFSKNNILMTTNWIDLNKKISRLPNFSFFKSIGINYNFANNLYFVFEDNNNVIEKDMPDNVYFVIKQKRFAAVFKNIDKTDHKLTFNYKNLTNVNAIVIKNQKNLTNWISAKRLKCKSSAIPLAYSKRMLRTRRVLTLPTNVNITIITNSFDVVHSWYIPGLGIKLDCVPGRSTHHTLFIDHAGFYYGQCAEICGRYHHHMPIRICALPFEHFLIWWYHYGLPKFIVNEEPRKTGVKSGIRQYNW